MKEINPSTATVRLLSDLFARFAPIGALPGGGVTRLAYTRQEDAMHDVFRGAAREMGFRVWEDCAGNSYAANFPENTDGYTLIGSHLDSVIEGGEYDGAAGVLAGLAVLRALRERKSALPVVVAAFRCEESSNFRLCTVGSGLVTGTLDEAALRAASGRDGVTLLERLREHGYERDTVRLRGCARYLELHIEQGRVLQERGCEIGVVSAIAAPHRYVLTLRGTAEHSGATPMALRRDSLCAAAEIILAVERAGRGEAAHNSVATVGAVENHPNVMNAVPGTTTLQIDLRGVHEDSIARMEQAVRRDAKAVCARRAVDCELSVVDAKRPVPLDERLQKALCAAAEAEGLSHTILPSGAGHDAMSFAGLCPTGMVFIPCRDGISHNIHEHTELSQIENGVRVLLRMLTDC